MMNYKELISLTETFRALASGEPWVVSKSKIHGTGLHARKFIPKGTKIGEAVASSKNRITYMGSQVNHQFNANAKLVQNHEGGCDLIALQDIEIGEEITVNYKNTPWYIDKNTKGYIELQG